VRSSFLFISFFFLSASYLDAAQPSQQVLLFYANETSPDSTEAANYQKILSWLVKNPSPEIDEIVRSLKRDLQIFKRSVGEDIEAIQRASFPSLIATNETVRSGYVLAKQNELRRIKISVVPTSNYILQSNPLSQSSTFQRYLQIALSEFPPSQYSYALIVKSHGDTQYALTPRLAVRSEETTEQQLVAVANGKVAKSELPEWSKNRLGVTKDDLLGVLNSAFTGKGYVLDWFVLDSCLSDSPDFDFSLFKNVRKVALNRWDRSARYHSLDYDQLKSSSGVSEFLEAQFKIHSQYQVYDTVSFGKKKWLQYLYFLPLFLILVWTLGGRFMRPFFHKKEPSSS
jgi:hypothetical protein